MTNNKLWVSADLMRKVEINTREHFNISGLTQPNLM